MNAMPASSPRAAPRRLHRLAAGVVLAVAAASPQAQIYCSGESAASGAVVLSNHASMETPHLLVAAEPVPVVASVPLPPAAAAAARPLKPDRQQIQTLVDRFAAELKVSPRLLNAVIRVESNFDAHAVSPKGAIGLMQLMPGTASRFGAADPYSASENIRAGASYLKWLDGLFQGNLELVLAAYNAGEQAVIKAGRRIPPIAETRAYVPKVLALFRRNDNAPSPWQ
jgi:soluble lytic murein transglycosylase-like protein